MEISISKSGRISPATSFKFDNLPGTTRTTKKTAANQVTSTIAVTGTALKMAERRATRGEDGSVTVTQITFEIGEALPARDFWKDITLPDAFATRVAYGVPLEIAPVYISIRRLTIQANGGAVV
ncbi:MAG: hypothetical protein LBK41_08110 [Clostridiales bacterium]|nr:hypothetical protein [Clostridiales bacterium]